MFGQRLSHRSGNPKCSNVDDGANGLDSSRNQKTYDKNQGMCCILLSRKMRSSKLSNFSLFIIIMILCINIFLIVRRSNVTLWSSNSVSSGGGGSKLITKSRDDYTKKAKKDNMGSQSIHLLQLLKDHETTCQQRKGRNNFFLDVGSNRGDVLEAFFENGRHRINSTNPEWQFGITNYDPFDWNVIGFEASPVHEQSLQQLETKYNLKYKNKQKKKQRQQQQQKQPKQQQQEQPQLFGKQQQTNFNNDDNMDNGKRNHLEILYPIAIWNATTSTTTNANVRNDKQFLKLYLDDSQGIWGGNNYAQWGTSAIKSWTSIDDNATGTSVEVPTMDLVTFFVNPKTIIDQNKLQLQRQEVPIVQPICLQDNVYLKINIEGAEFVVIQHLIQSQMLCYIDHIDMYWHPSYLLEVNDEGSSTPSFRNDISLIILNHTTSSNIRSTTPYQFIQFVKEQFQKCGTKIHVWHTK